MSEEILKLSIATLFSAFLAVLVNSLIDRNLPLKDKLFRGSLIIIGAIFASLIISKFAYETIFPHFFYEWKKYEIYYNGNGPYAILDHSIKFQKPPTYLILKEKKMIYVLFEPGDTNFSASFLPGISPYPINFNRNGGVPIYVNDYKSN